MEPQVANILRRCVAEDPARRPSARRLLRQLRGLRFPQGAAVNPPPPPPRTKWTRSVPHPVLIGHAALPAGRGGEQVQGRGGAEA